jgi:hypothetical protein
LYALSLLLMHSLLLVLLLLLLPGLRSGLLVLLLG